MYYYLCGQLSSGLSRSKHYQTPRLLLPSPKRTPAHSTTAFGHQQQRPAASAVTNSLRQATRSHLIMNRSKLSGPQGLKPSSLLALGGTAEAVPFPKPIYEIGSRFQIPMLFRSITDRKS